MSLPTTQRAWINIGRGTPAEALVLKEDWPVSSNLSDGDVLVKVQAAALNPVGYKLYKLLPGFMAGRPRVAEFDLAGVVVASKSPKFAVDDQVYGWVPSPLMRATNQGSLAQYVQVSADWIVHRPQNVTPVEASGITLVGYTAYHMIVTDGKVQPGQRVFVNGGSTSVGAFAIQIAKHIGAHVTASCSSKGEELVRRMGADEILDYTKGDLVQLVKEKTSSAGAKFDIIVEAVGLIDPSLYANSEDYLNPNGTFFTVGPQLHGVGDVPNALRTAFSVLRPGFLGGVKRRFNTFLIKNDPEIMEEMRKLVASGDLKPIVDSVFEFNDTLKAYDRIMSGRAKGKVVVKVDPSAE